MSSMFSFFILCVVFAVIDARIIRTDKVEVPDNGLTLKIDIKPDREGKMKVQVKSIDKGRKRMEDLPFKSHGFVFKNAADDRGVGLPSNRNEIVRTLGLPSKKNNDVRTRTVGLPSMENRFGIKGGVCPEGFVARGGFCFPDYD